MIAKRIRRRHLSEMPTYWPTVRREDGACQTDEIAPTSVTAEFGGYFVCRGFFVADFGLFIDHYVFASNATVTDEVRRSRK